MIYGIYFNVFVFLKNDLYLIGILNAPITLD